MAVDLINFKNLELLPIEKNNKLFVDNNNYLNINNNLKIKNLNIIQKNNLINFTTDNDISFDSNLLCKDLYSLKTDSRLFKNINNIDDNYCLNLVDKINIKSVTEENKEKIQIITDNLVELLPNSIKLISDFVPINKQYFFKTIEKNRIYIDTIEDGIYKVIDKNNNTFEIEIINKRAIKPNNINIKNKIFIYGKKVDDYKIININDLFPLIIKSIQELHIKHSNMINNIEQKLNNSLNNSLVNTEIINKLNSTYHKLLNEHNQLQNKYLITHDIIKENISLKKRLENLEIQMMNLIKSK
jgi:hypothetical protein